MLTIHWRVSKSLWQWETQPYGSCIYHLTDSLMAEDMMGSKEQRLWKAFNVCIRKCFDSFKGKANYNGNQILLPLKKSVQGTFQPAFGLCLLLMAFPYVCWVQWISQVIPLNVYIFSVVRNLHISVVLFLLVWALKFNFFVRTVLITASELCEQQ